MASFSEWSDKKKQEQTKRTAQTSAQSFSAWSNQKLGKAQPIILPTAEQKTVMMPTAPQTYRSNNTAFERSSLSRDEYDIGVRKRYAQSMATNTPTADNVSTVDKQSLNLADELIKVKNSIGTLTEELSQINNGTAIYTQEGKDRAAQIEKQLAALYERSKSLESDPDLNYTDYLNAKYEGKTDLYKAFASIGTKLTSAPQVVAETVKTSINNIKSKDSDALAADAEINKLVEELSQINNGTAIYTKEGKARAAEIEKELERLRTEAAGKAVDMNSVAMRKMQESNWLQNEATKDIESPAGKFLANTGLSIAQNVALLPTAAIHPAVPLVAMGTVAGAEKMYDVSTSGGSAGEALGRGFVAGGIEALTEKIPLDTVADLVKIGGKSAIKNMLKQAGVEATEEGLAYAMNYIADKAAGDDVEFSIQELLESAAAGGLSGLFFGFGGTVVGGIGSSGAGQNTEPSSGVQQGYTQTTPDQGTVETPMALGQKNTALHEAVINKNNEAPVSTSDGTSALSGDLDTVVDTGTDQNVPQVEQGVKNQDARSTSEAFNVPQGIVLPTAENNTLPGGMNHGVQGYRAAESGAAVADLSDGGAGRTSGTGTGGQNGVLAESAEGARQRAIEQSRAAVSRQNTAKSLRGQKVSSQQLGIAQGTDTPSVTLVEESFWDDGMKTTAERIYRETGKNVKYVLGRIQVRATDGGVTYARGVYTGDGIIIQADHTRLSIDQIADHEMFHDKVKQMPGVINELRNKIIERYGMDEFDRVMETYVKNLRGISVELSENATAEEIDAAMQAVMEEIFADAYAGINAFNAHAEQFNETVEQTLDERGRGRGTQHVAATERTTGPPEDAAKYSISPSFANEVRTWYQTTTTANRMTDGGWFEVGETSDALRSIGIKDGPVYWRRSKIGYVMQEHPEMTTEIIAQAPSIIEDPIIVLKSLTQADSIVAFAELKADGKPIMVALNLTPIPTGGMDADFSLISSAYGRTNNNAASLISRSDVLYLDENKKRTDTWLMSLGLQLPSGQPVYGSIGSVTYDGWNVNIRGVPWSDLTSASAANAEGTSKFSEDDDIPEAKLPGGEETVQQEEAQESEPAGPLPIQLPGGEAKKGVHSAEEDTERQDDGEAAAIQAEISRLSDMSYKTDLLNRSGFEAVEENEKRVEQLRRRLSRLEGKKFEKAKPTPEAEDVVRSIKEKAAQAEKSYLREQLGEANEAGRREELLKNGGFAALRANEYNVRKLKRRLDQIETREYNAAEVAHLRAELEHLEDMEYQERLSRESGLDETEILDRLFRQYDKVKKRLDHLEGKAQQAPKPEKKKATKPVAESKPIIAKNDLRKTMLGLFSIPEGQKAELGSVVDQYADRMLKNGRLTEDDRSMLFDRLYQSGVMTVQADQYYQAGRAAVAGGKVYVAESEKAEFGDDWNEFRKRAFAAGVYLTNDSSNSGVDVWNMELADALPGLFDAGELDSRTVLERIVQVAEEGKDENVSLPEYTARLAGEQFVSEQEVLDNMERQVDWALRTFAEKAELEIKLRDRTGIKIAQERDKFSQSLRAQFEREEIRRAKEREKRREMAQRARENRELRELQQNTLKQLQWLSKNRYKAPEQLKAAWDDVLGDIDIYAVNAANEMNWSKKYQATWKDLAQMYKAARESDPNFLPSKELERIVARLDSDKIADLDIGALQDLYKAAVGIRTEFYNRNNVINDEMNRLFAEVYTDAKDEIENAPGGYTGKGIDKLVNLDQLTPMNVLQRMGGWNPDGAFYSMARQLEKGERDIRAYTVQANAKLENFLTEHEDWVKKADGQGKDAIWYELEVPELLELHMGDKPVFGKTVKVYMTPSQKVHMYLESKNEDNLRHMVGGRTFADKKLYSEGKRQEAFAQGKTVKLAPETVKKIVSDLTAEEMEMARVLEDYYNNFSSEKINKVSNVLYGYGKAISKNYAPIYTNRNYTKSELGVFDTTAEGVGNLKARQYSKNPSYNIGAFDAFEKHVDQTARFVGMAIPARNWQTLLNWRETSNSTGDVLTHKWGEEGKRYITDLIERLQGGESNERNSVSSFADKTMSNYISAVFGANPSIVLKQLGSVPLASAYLGGKNFPSPVQIARIDQDLIGKYTSELAWRTMGYTTPETKQLKENPNWTQTNKFTRFTFGGGAITAMDGGAASILWPWAENKVRREFPDLEVGTREQIDAGQSPFYQKVAQEFNDAVMRSQSVSDEIHQSTLRKSKNPITRAFTLFKSDSAQSYNTLRQKIGEAQYYKRSGADQKTIRNANRAVGRTVISIIGGNLWAEVIALLMALWKNKGKKYRDDEGELTGKSIAKEMLMNLASSLSGVMVFGEELAEIIGVAFTDKTWYEFETPGLEQVNDLVELIVKEVKSWGEICSGAADVIKNDGDPLEYFRHHSNDIIGSVKELAAAAATYIRGIPVSNLEAYILGTVKWISPELATAYEDILSTADKADLAGLTGDALEQRVGTILNNRLGDVQDETSAALADLYEAGYKTAIPSSTPGTVSVDGESKKLNEYQQQLYEQAWRSVVAGEIDDLVSDRKFQNAEADVQAQMLDKLYDYATEKAKEALFDDYKLSDSWKEVDDAIKSGTSIADWAALKGITTVKMEPEEGSDTVTKLQRYREVVDSGLSEKDQLEALSMLMGDSEYSKLEAGHRFGISPEVYVSCKEMLPYFDADDNGRYTQEEIETAIDALGGATPQDVLMMSMKGEKVPQSMTLTNDEKAVLWQIITGSKSAKNNPYNKSVGQKVCDTLYPD